MNAEETVALVAALPSYSWSEARDLEGSGVYLIYAEDGALLYVGETTDYESRLCYHEVKEGSGNLYWHLADDIAGDGQGSERAHHCKCGKFTVCGAGDRLRPANIRRMLTKRFSRFTVRIALFERDDPRRFDLEQACQEHLRPQYPKPLTVPRLETSQ